MANMGLQYWVEAVKHYLHYMVIINATLSLFNHPQKLILLRIIAWKMVRYLLPAELIDVPVDGGVVDGSLVVVKDKEGTDERSASMGPGELVGFVSRLRNDGEFKYGL